MTDRSPNADALVRLEARLDGIEARLERLTLALERAPSAPAREAPALDRVEALLQRLEELEPAARVGARLTEPATAVALEEALRLLPKLTPVLRLAATFEDTVGMAADSLDAWAAEQAARGIELDDRLRTVLRLLETLTEPKHAEIAERMVRRLPDLEPVVELAATFEPTTAMLFDMFDEHVRGWQERGIDAEGRFRKVASLVERLTDPTFHEHLEELLDAAPALMAATRTGELFGVAVDEVTGAPVVPAMGPWALLRALSDPDVQRAAGFAVAIARKIGGRLPLPPKPRS